MDAQIKIQIHSDHVSVCKNETKHDFPFVWLRDNCQCPKCFDAPSKSRIIQWEHFNVDIKPSEIRPINDKGIKITWNDNHSSDYSMQWLQVHSFLKENRERYTKSTYRPENILWNKDDFNSFFKKFDFVEILNSNYQLREWLKFLSIYGIALIAGVPADHNSCRKLTDRIGFIKRTHFGEEFILKAKPITKSIAYTPMHLQLHTDSPYYEHMPGVNLLHCIAQTEDTGGENMLCDGFYIADQIKSHNIDEYNILSRTSVHWRVIGEEDGNKFYNMFRSPVLCEDYNGNVTRINYSVSQRGSHLDVSTDKVKAWYNALKLFIDMAHANSINFKISSGEMLTFNNKRILHGRTAYRDTPTNTRHIVGAYVDWDCIYSRMRVLNSELS